MAGCHWRLPGRIIYDFSIVLCSFCQRAVEGCHAMITTLKLLTSTCFSPYGWHSFVLQFINKCCKSLWSFFKVVHSAIRCAVPPESRQRRHGRLQGCCQKRPEAQEEAGREECEGGVQEGARRRRWDRSSVTVGDLAVDSGRDFSCVLCWLIHICTSAIRRCNICVSERVHRMQCSFGLLTELTKGSHGRQNSSILLSSALFYFSILGRRTYWRRLKRTF